MDSAINTKGMAAGMSVQARVIERDACRKVRVVCVNVILRLVCLITTVSALSLMVTAKQDSSISVFGLTLPVHSKWSFSDSFQYDFLCSSGHLIFDLLHISAEWKTKKLTVVYI